MIVSVKPMSAADGELRRTAMEILGPRLRHEHVSPEFRTDLAKWPFALSSGAQTKLWLREVEDMLWTPNNNSVEDYAWKVAMFATAMEKDLPLIPRSLPGFIVAASEEEFLCLLETTGKEEEASPQRSHEVEDDEANEDEAVALIVCACGGRATWSLRQTRGADEAMTQFCECKSCGKKWRQS